MPEILNRFIIYTYNDSAISFYVNTMRSLGKESRLTGTSYSLFDVISVDYISNVINVFLSKYIPFVLLNNLLVIIAVCLSLFFSYKLFRLLYKDIGISLIMAVINTFSNYFLFRVISGTQALYFTFTIPWIIYLLIKKSSPFKTALAVLCTFLISNYYGFFVGTITGFWYVIDWLSQKISFGMFIKKLAVFAGTLLLGIIVLFPNLFITNLPFKKITENKPISQIYRPLEDWYSFSYRPWYFFIPPNKSLYFEKLSNDTYDKIENTGYYLADGYIDSEMGGAYLGWHFIMSSLFVLILVTFGSRNLKLKNTFLTIYENKELIRRLYIVILLILLIAIPPIFTINGITIYTPTFLLYKIVPFFRTLVRWSGVIYTIVIMINGYLLLDLNKLAKNNNMLKYILLILFVLTTYFLTAIRLPIIDTTNIPSEYQWLKQDNDKYTTAIYPTANYDTIFWAGVTGIELENPRDLIDYKTGYKSEYTFDNLTKGYSNEISSKYIVLNYVDISNSTLRRIGKVDPSLTTREFVYDRFVSTFGQPIYNQGNEVFIFKNSQ